MAIQYQKTQQDIRLRRGIALPNNVETIPQLNAFIDGVAEEIGLDMSLTMSLNLAIEEAVVNVMNYAYPQGKQGDVNIEAIADDERLTFVISDSGAAFDPTAKEEADTTLSVEERPIGGLGIYLVRQLMDTINYERVDGKNVLTLIKNYSPNK
ncbi:MAG: ATP-binding protein [Prevotella sp.]|nr:ATP-binding protein [Prevotella sp.]